MPARWADEAAAAKCGWTIADGAASFAARRAAPARRAYQPTPHREVNDMGSASARLAGLGLAAVLAAGLTGAASAADAPVPWRHGVLALKSDAGFVTMITQHDFAKKHGLDLKLEPLKNENLALRALVAGQLDSYEGSPPFQADARGLNLKVLGCYWIKVPMSLFVSKGIDSVKGLEGKTIATSAPGSLPSLLAQEALAHFHVPAAKVKLAAVGGDADRYRALVGGVVQGAEVSAEYTPFETRDKVKNLLPMRDILPNYMRYCYITTAKNVAEHPKELANFLAAEMEALKYALSHRKETIALTRSETGAKPDDPRAAFIYDDVVKSHSIDPTLDPAPQKIQSMEDILLKAGILKQKVDVKAMVAPGPRQAALAEAGH
jgi:NitT/TauT family transport system substrate-binding protein